MKTLLTGATGLTGKLFLTRLAASHPGTEISCLVRPQSDRTEIDTLNLQVTYYTGDSSSPQTWEQILAQDQFDTIIHIVQIRQIPIILDSLTQAQQVPHLIIIGTTGVFSQYNQYSGVYKQAESYLEQYPGSYCLLRPTMIYGSQQDKNLHKLIKFCQRYSFFPVFGSGDNLLQPIHADDIAKTLLCAWERPQIHGAYDISGGTIVTFQELLALVEQLLDKPVRQISLPSQLGIWLATILEKLLRERSPVRREQILRLKEDKAYPHDAAKRDLDFTPRRLEVGLKQEVELLRTQGLI